MHEMRTALDTTRTHIAEQIQIMVVISLVNNKGGIAKTTTSIHLSAFLALLGYKVLVIDFDPQRNLSLGYKIAEDYPYTVLNLLKGESGFRVTQKLENLFVLAGSYFLDTETFEIGLLKKRLEQINKRALSNEQKPYDFVVVDCAPQPMKKKYYLDKSQKEIHIPKLNEIAVSASDYAMIPLDSEEFSINGLTNFIKDTISIREEFNPKMKIAGVFFTRVMSNENNFKFYYEDVRKSIPGKYFFETFIRKDVNIEKSKKLGKSIFEISPKSNASLDYKKLCEELLLKIN